MSLSSLLIISFFSYHCGIFCFKLNKHLFWQGMQIWMLEMKAVGCRCTGQHRVVVWRPCATYTTWVLTLSPGLWEFGNWRLDLGWDPYVIMCIYIYIRIYDDIYIPGIHAWADWKPRVHWCFMLVVSYFLNPSWTGFLPRVFPTLKKQNTEHETHTHTHTHTKQKHIIAWFSFERCFFLQILPGRMWERQLCILLLSTMMVPWFKHS